MAFRFGEAAAPPVSDTGAAGLWARPAEHRSEAEQQGVAETPAFVGHRDSYCLW
jgi:hypothetical protein